MKIQFDLDIDDQVAFYEHYQSTDGKRSLLKNKIICGGIPTVGLFLFVARDSIIGAAIFAGIVGIICYISFSYITRDSFIKGIRKLNGLDKKQKSFGNRSIEIQTDGLSISTSDTSVFHKWPALKKITRTKDYIFIWISPLLAYIIPIKKVDIDADMEQFYNKIHKQLSNENPTTQ